MRASLSLMVALALAGHAAPCLAQTTPDKAAPSQKQHATDAPVDRVDALSPDEARRAARARARAEAKKQPAVSATAKPGQAPTRAAAEPRPSPDARAASAKVKPPAPEETATTPEPRPDKAARETADQAAPARSVRHAARPPHLAPPREAAEDDWHHPRHRPYTSAARHPSGGLAGPKVGDVVPPGVPLYPLPPGYGPHPPGARAGLPPFPRSRDDEAEDDDGPPPHGFMAPY